MLEDRRGGGDDINGGTTVVKSDLLMLESKCRSATSDALSACWRILRGTQFRNSLFWRLNQLRYDIGGEEGSPTQFPRCHANWPLGRFFKNQNTANEPLQYCIIQSFEVAIGFKYQKRV